MILTWMSSVLDWAQIVFSRLLVKVKSTFMRAFSIASIFLFLLWAAMFMYASFHYFYMPSKFHVKQVHFHYAVECEEASSKLCSFPSANFSLLQRGEDQFLMPGQAYSIKLDLELPESPVNQRLGMFLVRLDLHTSKGIVVSSVRRSAMIRFKSALLQTMETLANAPLYLFGLKEQKQDLSIALHEHFEDDAYHPVIGAFIELQTKNIELYSAYLRIYAELSGLRYLIIKYPVLAAIFGISSNLSFLMAVTLLTWYKTSQNSKSVPEENAVTSLEERRRMLRANVHRERAISGSGAQDASGARLRKMSASSNRKIPSSQPAPDQNPEIISATGNQKINTLHSTKTELNDNDDVDSAMELRQRKVEQRE